MEENKDYIKKLESKIQGLYIIILILGVVSFVHIFDIFFPNKNEPSFPDIYEDACFNIQDEYGYANGLYDFCTDSFQSSAEKLFDKYDESYKQPDIDENYRTVRGE